MIYEYLDTTRRREIIRGRLLQLEDDHYRRSLDLQAVKGASAEARAKRAEIQADLDEFEGKCAADRKELAALDKAIAKGAANG